LPCLPRSKYLDHSRPEQGLRSFCLQDLINFATFSGASRKEK
jgi:hypothetical protein